MVDNAIEVLKAMAFSFCNQRDIDDTISYVTDDIEWIDIENNGFISGKEELKAYLLNELKLFSEPLDVELSDVKEQKINEYVILISFVGNVSQEIVKSDYSSIRGSACAVNLENKWYIKQFHVSVANRGRENRSLKEELDNTRKKEAMLLATIPDGVAIYRINNNRTFKTDYVSEGLAKMLKYDSAKELLTTIEDGSNCFVFAEDVEPLIRKVGYCVKNNLPVEADYRLYTKDGEIIYNHLSANCILGEQLQENEAAVVYAVHTIVAEEKQKEIQEQNDVLNEALQEARKANQSKTDFLSRVSHDMRTPMNGILGLADLSMQETDANVLKDNMQKIHSSGEYLLGLINDTLDFEKIESGKLILEPQVVLVRDVIESIKLMVEPTAKTKGIDFRIELINADVDCYVKIDAMRIKQIFMNLISNAIKFTPEGGTVEVRLECIGNSDMVTHSIISVADTGIGMSEDYLQTGLFQPFSQEYNEITSSSAGSGLGLSIVKRLISLMDGTISVESEKGVGSKFTVCLDFDRVEDFHENEVSTEEKKSEADYETILCGKHILLAEDHPLNAEIARKLLERKQCEVIWVKNGQECIDQYRNNTEGYFDLILMDIRMPVMGGLEAAKRLRCERKADSNSIPILAMTANAYENEVKESYLAGMNGHLTKPIETAVFYHEIAKAITNYKK